MNKITYRQLKKLRACEDQLELFKDTFGDEVKFDTLEEALELGLKYYKVFDFEWLGEKLFGDTYQEAIKPLLVTHRESTKPIWNTYWEELTKVFVNLYWNMK